MINFFRRIRKKLADDNKPLKYMRYAIGEIVLVVIGILIALQINNWNEERNLNTLSKTYLIDIKKDLIADTTTFDAGIKRIEKTLIYQERLFNPDIVNKLITDSLITLLNQTFHSTRIYKINNSTFLKLTNSGFVENKSFNEIFIDINEYYTKEFNTWFEYLEWDKESDINVFSPESLSKWYDEIDLINLANNAKPEFNVGKVYKTEKIFKEFLQSPRFRNYAWTNNYKMKLLLERMKYQKKTADELIKRIDTALKLI